MDKSYNLNINVRPSGQLPHFPNVSRPHAVGCYSVNTSRNYVNSAENLSYYVEPLNKYLPLDLNIGYELAIKKDPEQSFREHLVHILSFICDNRSKLFNGDVLNADFVCYRGALRLLMSTPYEHRNDWCLHATHYRNTVYLSENETQQKHYERQNETPMQKRMCSWGFKFEQYCTSDDPHKPQDTTKPVDECSEFGCVYQTTIGSLHLLYAAEMDAVLSDRPIDKSLPLDLNKLKFTELKTRLENLTPHQERTYLCFKTRNWWCQCFLAGIDDLRIGLRDNNGLVHRVEQLNLNTLHHLGKRYWSPAVCVDFLLRILNSIKAVMANIDDPYTVFEFYYKANTGSLKYRVFENENAYTFLPASYRKFMKRDANCL